MNKKRGRLAVFPFLGPMNDGFASPGHVPIAYDDPDRPGNRGELSIRGKFMQPTSHELGDVGVGISVKRNSKGILDLGGIQYDLQSGFCLE